MVIHKIYEKKLTKEVKDLKMPNHIAIIMDGNRRYARRRGLPTRMGHMFGSRKAEEVLNWCWDLGVKSVTIYAFSTENFRRKAEEKDNIFDVVEKELYRLSRDDKIHKDKIKVNVVGKTELLPQRVVDAIRKVEQVTQNYEGFNLNIALAYGGRQELMDSIRKVISLVKRGEVSSADIDDKLIQEHLYSNGDYSEVDLIIRTGGELRLSNFLTWQTASSAAYFCDVFWPQFRKIDLLRAIRTWQNMLELRKQKRVHPLSASVVNQST